MVYRIVTKRRGVTVDILEKEMSTLILNTYVRAALDTRLGVEVSIVDPPPANTRPRLRTASSNRPRHLE